MRRLPAREAQFEASERVGEKGLLMKYVRVSDRRTSELIARIAAAKTLDELVQIEAEIDELGDSRVDIVVGGELGDRLKERARSILEALVLGEERERLLRRATGAGDSR